MVHLLEPFEFSEAAQPGAEPSKRICWRGEIYQADGKTIDTTGIWEQNGAYQNTQSVIQRNDLVTLVRLDPEPEPPPKERQALAA